MDAEVPPRWASSSGTGVLRRASKQHGGVHLPMIPNLIPSAALLTSVILDVGGAQVLKPRSRAEGRARTGDFNLGHHPGRVPPPRIPSVAQSGVPPVGDGPVHTVPRQGHGWVKTSGSGLHGGT